MREFSQQAVDMASQFLGSGGGGSGARAGSRFPHGLNVGNMRDFAGSPAGKQLMGHIKSRVKPAQGKTARIQI